MNSIALSTSSKRRDNRGSSIVKLIIIVAIVAALAAIIVPRLLRHIELTRVEKDATTLNEVSRAITYALSDRETYTEVIKSSLSAELTLTLSYSVGGTLSCSDAPAAALLVQMQKTLGGDASTAGEISNLPALVSKGRLIQDTVYFTVVVGKDGSTSVSYPASAE